MAENHAPNNRHSSTFNRTAPGSLDGRHVQASAFRRDACARSRRYQQGGLALLTILVYPLLTLSLRPVFARFPFRPIPFSEIGLYKDRYRATWSVEEAVTSRYVKD